MAKVVTPDGETEMFEIKVGVLQGDTLAPYLFIIVLDYALRRERSRLYRHSKDIPQTSQGSAYLIWTLQMTFLCHPTTLIKPRSCC